jgi:hypothetical protein
LQGSGVVSYVLQVLSNEKQLSGAPKSSGSRYGGRVYGSSSEDGDKSGLDGVRASRSGVWQFMFLDEVSFFNRQASWNLHSAAVTRHPAIVTRLHV